MHLKTLGPYDFAARDSVGNFPAPLLYIGWDRHLMLCAPFCLPLPPDMPFAALRDKVLPDLYGQHPDFAHIDWAQVQWRKGGQPWQPDEQATLTANGLGHKEVIRFITPELKGIAGSGS